MSHTVTLNYINKNYALENAKQILNKINDLITKFKNYFGLQYLLKQQAKQVQEIVDGFHDTLDEDYYHVERKLSHLDNMFNSLKTSANLVIKALEQETIDVQGLLEQHGNLAFVAFAKLVENKQTITQEQVEKMIIQIADKPIGQTEIKVAKQIINDGKVDDVVKNYWLNQISKMTYKTYADLSVTISDQERQKQEMEQAFAHFKAIYENIGFKTKGELKKHLDKKENLLYEIDLVNHVNNLVTIKINHLRQIEYKLGNYQGHLCEEAANKFLDMIKNKGEYKIVSRIINRDNDQGDLTLSEPIVEEEVING